jgi:hypothetical protein
VPRPRKPATRERDRPARLRATACSPSNTVSCFAKELLTTGHRSGARDALMESVRVSRAHPIARTQGRIRSAARPRQRPRVDAAAGSGRFHLAVMPLIALQVNALTPRNEPMSRLQSIKQADVLSTRYHQGSPKSYMTLYLFMTMSNIVYLSHIFK